MENLAITRIAVLLLAFIQVGVFFAFYKVIIRYRHRAAKRLSLGVACIVALIAVLLCQFQAYELLSNVRNPIENDSFFFWLLVVEWAIPTFALFAVLVKMRKGRPL
jgi:ABC-type glycerol-3-phosphate transport system permease component